MSFFTVMDEYGRYMHVPQCLNYEFIYCQKKIMSLFV